MKKPPRSIREHARVRRPWLNGKRRYLIGAAYNQLRRGCGGSVGGGGGLGGSARLPRPEVGGAGAGQGVEERHSARDDDLGGCGEGTSLKITH